MNQNEMKNDEYRRKAKRENLWYYIRVTVLIIALIVLAISDIAIGLHLYYNDYSTIRVIVGTVAWIFVFIISGVCIFMFAEMFKEFIIEPLASGSNITKEEITVLLYTILIVIIMAGGAQFLFWHFTFK